MDYNSNSKEELIFELEKANNKIAGLELELKESKKREEKFLESEEKFRAVSEHSQIGIGILRGRDIIYLNKAWNSILGFDESEPLESRLWDYIHPDMQEEVAERHKARLRGEKVPERYEVKMVNKFGKIVWIDLLARLINYDGEPAAVMVVSDITDYKNTLEALAESEEKFRAVADYSPIGISILRGDRNLYNNKSWHLMLGYDENDPYNLYFWDLIHPDMKEEVIKRQEARLRGEKVPNRYDIKMINKNGGAVWFDMSVKIINYGGEPAALTVASDITEYRNTLKALKESEEKFRAVAEYSPIGIAILRGRNMIYLNKAWHSMLGFDETDPIHFDPWDNIHPDMKEEVATRHNARLKGEKVAQRYDLKMVTKSGKTVWFDLSAKLIDYEGEPAALMVASDITGYKNTLNALAESEEKFRKFSELSPAGISIQDLEQYYYVNEAWTSITGYSVEEGSLMGPMQVIHPDMKDYVAQTYSNRTWDEYETNRYDLKIKTKNNEEKWIDLSSAGITIDGKQATIAVFTDITELKKTREILIESEHKWRYLAENIPDLILTLKKDGTIITSNRPMDLPDESSSGDNNYFKYIPDDYKNKAKQVIGTVIETEIPETFELLSHCRDKKQLLWFSTRVVPLRDDNSEKIAMLICTDISEKKKAKKALKKSEENYKMLIDNIKTGVIVHSSDERILIINNTAKQIFDINPEKYVNKIAVKNPLTLYREDKSILPKDEYPVHLVITQNTAITDYVIGVTKFENEDIRWFIVNAVPVYEKNKIDKVLVTFVEISDRIRVEEEVNFFFNTALDMLCIADFNGYLKKLSPTWSKILGWSSEELMSKPFLDFVHVDDRDTTVQATNALGEGTNIVGFENRYMCKDGSYRWIAWNSTSVPDRKLIIAAARDVTNKKKIENELMALNNELEERVLERTVQLENAYKKIETALEKEKEFSDLQSRFINMISHEYRTPLTIIQSNLEIIGLLVQKGEYSFDKNLNNIKVSLDVLKRLVEDVVTFSRNDAETLQFNPIPLDIVKVMKGICEEYDIIDNQKHNIIFESDEDSLSLMSDRNKIRMIVSHIMNNAIKYSPEKTDINVVLENTDDNVIIKITDNGVGIAREDMKHLFDPFIKNKEAIGVKSGVGLGLPVVKKYIETLKASIDIESNIGKGTKVTLTFPK